MSIVVTCAATRLGLALARAMAGRGDLVLADAEPQRLTGRAPSRHADLDDPLSLAAAFAGADTVLLPGGPMAMPGAPALAAAIEAARAAGVERIVLVSSTDPRPGNPGPWAEADRTAEALVRASGLGWTVARTQEDLDDFIGIGRRQQPGKRMFANRGAGRSAPVAIDDAAAALAAILADAAHGGRTYDLTGPALVGTAELAAALGMADIAHKDAKYLDQLRAEGVAAAEAHAQVALGRAVREGYLALASDDVRVLTGKPPRGLAEALAGA